MRTANDKLLDAVDVAYIQNSDVMDMQYKLFADVTDVITGNNPSNVTFDTGTMEVQTFTFPAKAGITDGDHIIFYEPDGTAWAIALDTDGTTAPSSSTQWDAVAAGNRVVVDCTSTTDAASVAAAVETAVDGLTGFTSVIVTDDTAADGTMTFTQVVPGVVSDAVPLDDTAAGAGSITSANTTQGVATEVDISNDQVTVPSHGLLTGVKITELTTTGTLPAGLSLSTVYYAIVVDSNTLSFATSQANALAGTAVDITGYGTSTAVHTISIETALAGTVKLQKNNDSHEVKAADKNWLDLDDDEILNDTNSRAYAAATSLNWVVRDFGAMELRAVVTNTSGTTVHNLSMTAKGA